MLFRPPFATAVKGFVENTIGSTIKLILITRFSLTIYVKSSVTALGQPLWKRLPVSDWADPQILRRSRGKQHHHGDDVCGGSCVCVDSTFRIIPTVGNIRRGSFLFPPRGFLLPPELFRTQIGVKLLNVRFGKSQSYI